MKELISESIIGSLEDLWGVISSPFETMAMALYNFLFGEMNAAFAGALENPIIEAISLFATFCCWLVFFASLVFYMVKIVQEEKRNWAVIFKCFINTFLFCAGNQLLAKLCFVFPLVIVEGLDFLAGRVATIEDMKDFILGQALIGDALSTGTMMLILLVAMIGFFIVAMMRVGGIFTQILIAPFYVPAVLLGDDQKWQEWVTSTVAVGLTYVVQFMMFFTGTLLLRNCSSFVDMMIAFACLFGTFAVPKALLKFGWTSGGAHSLQSMTMPATSLVSTLVRMR